MNKVWWFGYLGLVFREVGLVLWVQNLPRELVWKGLSVTGRRQTRQPGDIWGAVTDASVLGYSLFSIYFVYIAG